MFNLRIVIFLILLASSGCGPSKNTVQAPVFISDNDSLQKPAATPEEYYKKDFLRYNNYSYKPTIKTVQLHNAKDPLTPPILLLGGDEVLRLSFDDLESSYKNLSYTFIHCNADWTPSGLWDSEYIDGFTENPITDHRFSFNTLQRYIHYKADFPNSNTRFTKSGNYLVMVYENGNKENIVLTRRFMVFEEKVVINAVVKRPTLTQFRSYKQEIDFTINRQGFQAPNPFSELKVVVMQNFRWDNAILNLKPLFINGDELVYDYNEENLFNGNKEYRNFDIRTIRHKTEFIGNIELDTINRVYLTTSEPRSSRRYVSEQDINGKYLVKVREGRDDNAESDYAQVHFRLKTGLIPNGQLYVFGALSDWDFKDEFKMKFDETTQSYHVAAYLKQGYYNYDYVFLEEGKTAGDDSVIEGFSFETENDYAILVYHRAVGRNYDQLVGLKSVNSRGTF